MKNKVLGKRILIGILAVTMLVTMMPFMGGTVFAEEEKEQKLDPAIVSAAKEAGIDPKDEETVRAFADALRKDGILFDNGEIAVGAAQDDEELEKAEEITKADGTPVDPDNVPAAELSDGSKKRGLAVDSDSYEENSAEFGDFTDYIAEGSTEIKVGDKVLCAISSQGEVVTYMFIPSSDGSYFFSSSDGEEGTNVDPVGRVVVWDEESSSYKQLKSNDDDNGSHFNVVFSAKRGKVYYLQAIDYGNNDTGSFNVQIEKDEYEAAIDVSFDKATGTATVTGTVTGDTFYDLYVDGDRCYADIDGDTSFTVDLDMKDYPVGFHTVYAELEGHGSQVYYENAVPTYIYSKPANKLSYFNVGYNYFIFSYGGSSYSNDYDCGIGLDYRKKGGSWKTGYGPYSTSTSVKMTKMKSGKKYQVRTYYAKLVEYGGETYLFTGKETGKASKTVTFKTGGKKLSVKSLKISKAKQYSRKQTFTTWIYIGGYGYPRTVTYKYWYTDFRITLKLRKKPGAAGVYIGSKRIRGNKKKYTTTMHFSGKQKGKTLRFELCSYQSKTYYGHSKSVYKKVKVR